MRTANQKKADRLAQVAYGGAVAAARYTPTLVDDVALKGLGVFRVGLRHVANWIRRRGWVLVALTGLACSGCATIKWADRTLLEWVPCPPMEQQVDKREK